MVVDLQNPDWSRKTVCSLALHVWILKSRNLIRFPGWHESPSQQSLRGLYQFLHKRTGNPVKGLSGCSGTCCPKPGFPTPSLRSWRDPDVSPCIHSLYWIPEPNLWLGLQEGSFDVSSSLPLSWHSSTWQRPIPKLGWELGAQGRKVALLWIELV